MFRDLFASNERRLDKAIASLGLATERISPDSIAVRLRTDRWHRLIIEQWPKHIRVIGHLQGRVADEDLPETVVSHLKNGDMKLHAGGWQLMMHHGKISFSFCYAMQCKRLNKDTLKMALEVVLDEIHSLTLEHERMYRF